MATEIVVALIGLGGSALGSFVAAIISSKVWQYRIEQLEKKVEKHNNLVERMYGLEQKEELMEEKIRVANHRIEDLEHYHK
jgi:demethoxyubiquinone hydroxylase (CLK1/Coq7/Cat5 family)